MLTLTLREVVDLMRHVIEAGDSEVVGAIVRHVSTHEPRVVRLSNVHEEPEQNFEVAEKEVVSLYRAMGKRHEYLDVIYHSHTQVEAIPSAGDVEHADLEDAHYLIIAPNGRGRPFRSWRIVDGEASEEQVRVLA